MKASSLIRWSACLLTVGLSTSQVSFANTFTSTTNTPLAAGQCLSVKNNVWVGDRVKFDAQLLALGGNLDVGANAIINSSVNAGLSGSMRDRSIINGDITVGTTMTVENNGVIQGQLLEHTATDNVIIHSLPLLPASGNAVKIASDHSVPLTPGSYGDIYVDSRGTLELSAGDYVFETLHLATNSVLEYSDEVQVVVNGKITISQQSRVIALSDDDTLSLYNHDTEELKLGDDVSFTGQIHSPNSKVTVGARSDFTGCINARGLQFLNDSQFVEGHFVPLFTPPPPLEIGQCLSVGNHLRLDDRAVLDSDKVAVGGNLRAFANATIDGDINVGGNAMMRDRSVILGDATIGKSMVLINQASVSGVLSQRSSTDDVVVNTRSAEASKGNNVWVGLDKTKWLAPGNYRNLKVASRGRLILNAGEYHFSALNLATNASIIYRGDVTVTVNDNIVILDRSSVTSKNNSGTLSLYTHQTKPVVLATDVRFQGQIHAPKAQVRLGARSKFEGCVNSKGLRLFHDSRLTEGEYIPVF